MNGEGQVQKTVSTSDSTAELRSLLGQLKSLESDRRDAQTRLVNTDSTQRSSLLRDVLTISITLLIGAMTLYTVAPHLVRTPVLFFISLTFLLLSTVINILGRIQVLNYTSNTVNLIENYYAGAVAAQSNVQATNRSQDSVTRLTVYNEQGGPRITSMRWLGRMSHLYASAFLLIGLLGVGASLLLRITV